MSGERKALIVANEEYEQEGLRQLLAPAADADQLKQVLGDQQIGDFAVQVVRNEPAHVIQAQIEELFAAGQPDDVLLLHFSCHGLKSESGELFFAAPNTRPNRLGSTAISADFVQRCMRASRARSIVLLLDCCYGGAFAQGVAVRASGDVNVLGSFPRERLGGGRGRAVITASSAMEYAFEGDRLADRSSPRPSVFTGALVEGLITGDADRDQDGWVSLNELYDYIFDKVREQNPHQTPSRDFEMQGDLYIARRSRPVTTPAPLPPALQQAIDQPLAGIRAGAVQELVRMLQARHAGLALAARLALERLTEDDSRAVSAAAAAALRSGMPPDAAAQAGADPSAVSERESVISDESGSVPATASAPERAGAAPASSDAAPPQAPDIAATAALSNEVRRPVPSRLELSTTTVDFGQLPHHSQSPERRIRLGSTGGGSLNARARTKASWLEVRQEGEELLVAADTDTIGEHEGTVTIDSDGGSAAIFVRAHIVPASQPAPETAAATPSDETVPAVHGRARPGPRQSAASLNDRPVPELATPAAGTVSPTAHGNHSGAAMLSAAGCIMLIIPLSICALGLLQRTSALWPWWTIVFTSALGIVATLSAVRKNVISASILLWNLTLFIVFSLSLIPAISSQSNSPAILVTESAIWSAGNVALCAWILAMGFRGIRKVDPLLTIFVGSLSVGLVLTAIALKTGPGPVNNAAGWTFIVAVLINLLASMRALRLGANVG
jgi:Caspase domain